MSVTPTEFLLDATLDAYEGEARVFSKEWTLPHSARPRLTADGRCQPEIPGVNLS